MYYDNTGGAVYERTPRGMEDTYRTIEGKEGKDDREKVKEVREEGRSSLLFSSAKQLTPLPPSLSFSPP